MQTRGSVKKIYARKKMCSAPPIMGRRNDILLSNIVVAKAVYGDDAGMGESE